MNKFLRRLSHVGIHTSDLERSVQWYTQVLGLEEAFRLCRGDRPWIVYVHLTEDTFIELFAAREGQTPPHTHFSIEVADIEAAVADLRERLPPESVCHDVIITGADGSRIFNFFDPDGHRIEFQQFPAESQQARSWKRLTERGTQSEPVTG